METGVCEVWIYKWEWGYTVAYNCIGMYFIDNIAFQPSSFALVLHIMSCDSVWYSFAAIVLMTCIQLFLKWTNNDH